MALQPDPALDPLAAWWQGLVSDPAPTQQIASTEGIPAPSPIVTPAAVEPLPAQAEVAPADLPTPEVPEAPEPIPFGQMQPGLSVPRAAVDDAAAVAQGLDERHEAAVDARVDGSFKVGPETELRSHFEEVADARGRMTPLEAAQDDAFHARVLAERSNAEIAKAATRDREEAEAAHQAWIMSRNVARQERAQIDAEAKQLAEQRIGASDWYEEGGIGRAVGAMLLGAAGGLVQHLNNGRNVGLEAVDRSIERFIATRQADRQHQRAMLGDRRQSLAEQMAQADADYREAQVFRKAAYERALQQIEIEQQNYDPEGSRARAMDNARRELKAKMTANELAEEMRRAKIEEEKAKARREAERIEIERRRQEEEARHHKAAERNTAYGIASENKRAAERIKVDREQLELEARKVAVAGDKEQAKLIRERALGGELQPELDAQGKPVLDADGNPKFKRGLITQKDGSVFIPQGSEGEIATLRNTKSATDFVVDVLDRVRRRRTGWTSDFAKSAENQQLKTDWAAAKVIAKDVLGLGALSGPDEVLIDNFLGTDDPTQWRDPTAGIEASRRNVLGIYNSRARVLGADKEYSPPDTAKYGKAKEQPGDQELRDVLGDHTALPTDRLAADLGATSEDLRGNMGGLWSKFHANGGVLPSVARTIDAWGEAAKSTDEKVRKVALDRLGKVANEAHMEGVRKYAREALLNSAGADMGRATEDAATSSSTTAQDTVLEPPKGAR